MRIAYCLDDMAGVSYAKQGVEANRKWRNQLLDFAMSLKKPSPKLRRAAKRKPISGW